jgi:hypothetical protein
MVGFGEKDKPAILEGYLSPVYSACWGTELSNLSIRLIIDVYLNKTRCLCREAVIHSADGGQHQTRDGRGEHPPDPDHHQGEGAAPQDRLTASWTDLGPEKFSMKDTAPTPDDICRTT